MLVIVTSARTGRGGVHLLGNDLARRCAELVEVGIPQLDEGLVAPPLLVNQEAEDDAGSMLAATGFLRGLDDLGRDDLAVRAGDKLRVELDGHALLDQMADAEGDLGNGGGGDGGLDRWVAVDWEDCGIWSVSAANMQ